MFDLLKGDYIYYNYNVNGLGLRVKGGGWRVQKVTAHMSQHTAHIPKLDLEGGGA